MAVSFVTENDVDLIHEVEAVLGKQLEKFDCKENEVLAYISKVRNIISLLRLTLQTLFY